MAVGLTETCEKCGDSWDSGRTSRAFHNMVECEDRLASQREYEDEVAAFNAKSVDERLEMLRRQLDSLAEQVGRIPWDGPIG